MMRYATCHPDRKHLAKGFCAQCYERQRGYRNRNSATSSKNWKEWYSKPENKIHWMARKKSLYLTYKQQAFDLLGRKCVVCGFSDERALQIDHIHGDGYLEWRGASLYLNVLKHPERYQVLCANHNWIKRIENKEGPRGPYVEQIEKLLLEKLLQAQISNQVPN